jgi:uncharacterized protein YaaR (DUF327 family)
MDVPRIQPVEERRGGETAQHGFLRHMSTMQDAEYQEYIHDLSDRITRQGERLGEKVDIAEFQKYRELISELFNETASNSYLFCKSDKFDSRGRHKVFTVIRKVNQRLDEIAEMILKNEADNLSMLDAVDDIRGMLVDMFL